MAQTTAIEWTDLSWNPTHGCSKVSPGCAHCYAETLSRRYNQTPKPWTPANAAENVILKPHKLREPLSGAKAWQGLGDAAARAGKTDGKLVFVNSMSDLFHEQIPDEYIDQVFAVMAWAHWHTFQVLTKRPERMRDYMLAAESRVEEAMCSTCMATKSGLCGWPGEDCGLMPQLWPPPNVWLGVSIENRRYVQRADILRETPAAVRFISAEPLLGPLVGEEAARGVPRDPRVEIGAGTGLAAATAAGPGRDHHGQAGARAPLDLTDIDWLIAGGESGPGHRPIKPEWARDLRDACLAQCELCAADPSAIDAGGCLYHDRPAFLMKQWGGPTSKSGGRELDGRTWDEFPQVAEVRA